MRSLLAEGIERLRGRFGRSNAGDRREPATAPGRGDARRHAGAGRREHRHDLAIIRYLERLPRLNAAKDVAPSISQLPMRNGLGHGASVTIVAIRRSGLNAAAPS